MAGLALTIARDPGKLAKNRERAIIGKSGKPFVAHPQMPKRIVDQLRADAFTANVATFDGPVVVGVVAYWGACWSPKGRAPGRPKGDVDAVVAALLDALGRAGLYHDDAQVAVLVAANAVDTRDPRVEAFVGPLTPDVLAWMGRRLSLEVPAERVQLGGQQEALLR